MKQTRFMASILIAAVLIAAAMGVLQVMPSQAQGEYNVPCHIEQGGVKAVGGPGCEYEFQPGSQVDFQSGIYNGNGATIVISESVSITGTATLGGNLILEKGETIANSQNDYITMTTATTGEVSIAVGNLRVGDGVPGTAMDGEDSYFNGNVEVDGTAKLDGAVNIAGVETVTGRRVAATWDNTTIQTVLVITNDTEIVPTGSLQPIWVSTGTAGVGTGSITTTGMTVGNILRLINVGTPAIGITDTGVFSLSANMSMTRDDALTLMYIGGGWLELSRSTN